MTAQAPLHSTAPPDRPIRTANTRTSSRIGRYLIISALVFAVLAGGFAFWITREHDRLAASASEQMVRGGLSTLEETLRTVTMDFAIWPDAVKATAEGDDVWIWENIGISAAVTETTDLMMVLEADGSPAYGWAPGMDAEPSTTLIPEEAVAEMRSLLNAVPIQDRRAVSTTYRGDGAIWMLATARIVSEDPAEDPATDAEISRLIFGYQIDDDLLQGIGEQYLIDDLHLEPDASMVVSAVPLNSYQGEPVAYAAWTPPQPGQQILWSIALPMVIVLILLTVFTLVSSHLLSRSARRLEGALYAAEAASGAKTDFIANISHELRTPMNGIVGLTRLLQQTSLSDRQQNLVKMLGASTETQMQLIDDLLDISSIENGKLSLNVTPFSPSETVENVAKFFEMEASDKGLELELAIDDPDRTQVLGDRGRFHQICANLVSNAIKFTPDGKVTIALHIRERLGGARLSLEVTDTGDGIPAEEQDLIFDRFAQGTEARRSKSGGSGLGLAITKTLIDLMGGTISLDSAAGRGTTFAVELDLDKVEAPARQAG
ncbi:MAG: ATP-binding protein [Pseudomonadota bacterium]